jgi:hypothetical protein
MEEITERMFAEDLSRVQQAPPHAGTKRSKRR